MDAKRSWFGFVAVLSMTAVASPAVGQLCLGVPLDVGQTSLAFTFDMPDGANIIGLGAANRLAGPLVVGANYALTTSTSDVVDNGTAHTVGGRVAANFGTDLIGACPVAGVNATFADGYSRINVPLGVALAGAVEVDSGISVVPFVVPQFIWTRTSVDGLDESNSSTDFGVNGGLNLVVSNLFFGATIQRLIEDGAPTVFGVQAGIVF